MCTGVFQNALVKLILKLKEEYRSSYVSSSEGAYT